MIIIKNLKKSFKNNLLFEKVNLEIKDGIKTLIKGVNGSGKSVLMKMIVGYSKMDDGEIIIDGKVIGQDMEFLIDAGISINSPEFMKDLTGYQNLKYLANIRKIADDKVIYDLADKLDMRDILNKKYKTYSLGMKQKLRIIQALMENPKYLIIDEPFDALDKSSQAKLNTLLNDFISDKNKAIIFTTHSNEFENIADEVYEIDNHNLILTKQYL